MVQCGFWSEVFFCFKVVEKVVFESSLVVNNLVVVYEVLGLFDDVFGYYWRVIEFDFNNCGFKCNYLCFVEFYQGFKRFDEMESEEVVEFGILDEVLFVIVNGIGEFGN